MESWSSPAFLAPTSQVRERVDPGAGVEESAVTPRKVSKRFEAVSKRFEPKHGTAEMMGKSMVMGNCLYKH